MEGDATADKKAHERTEGATAAVQANHGDSYFAKRVQAGPISSTSFGTKTKPPTLPRWDEVLVDKGAVAPKPFILPVKMRTLTAAGDLRPAGKASTNTRIAFNQRCLWFCPTNETNSERTSIQCASYYRSFRWN